MSYETSSYKPIGHDRIVQDTDNALSAADRKEELLSELFRLYMPEKEKLIDDLKNKCAKYKSTIADLAIENNDLKKENLQLKQSRNIESITIDAPPFDYAINRRIWKNGSRECVPVKYIKRMADQLLDLAEAKDENGEYLIRYAKDLAPIYMILSKSNRLSFNYVGQRPDFEFFWNDNVAERIKDSARKTTLTCHENTLGADMNNGVWNGFDIKSWNRLIGEGENSNEYRLGVKLKEIIEAFTF